jgi:hypothetical protein
MKCYSILGFTKCYHVTMIIENFACSTGIIELDPCSSLELEVGPMRLRMTGRKTSPLNRPKATTRKKILKKVRKTCELDVMSRQKARKVEKPPLNTAGPMSTRLCVGKSEL